MRPWLPKLRNVLTAAKRAALKKKAGKKVMTIKTPYGLL